MINIAMKATFVGGLMKKVRACVCRAFPCSSLFHMDMLTTRVVLSWRVCCPFLLLQCSECEGGKTPACLRMDVKTNTIAKKMGVGAAAATCILVNECDHTYRVRHKCGGATEERAVFLAGTGKHAVNPTNVGAGILSCSMSTFSGGT